MLRWRGRGLLTRNVHDIHGELLHEGPLQSALEQLLWVPRMLSVFRHNRAAVCAMGLVSTDTHCVVL